MIKKSGIYKLHWPGINNYFYIGQTICFRARKINHFRDLKNQNHFNEILQRVFNKYGFPEFEILEECDKNLCTEREQFYIDKYFNTEGCCNLRPKAENNTGYKYSEESKDRMKIAQKYKFVSEETKELIRKSLSGRKLSPRTDEVKKKISSKNLGEGNGMYGRFMSEEEKIKHVEKTLKGKNNYRYRPVKNTETGIVYDTLQEAADSIGMWKGHLWQHLNKNKVNKTTFVYV